MKNEIRVISRLVLLKRVISAVDYVKVAQFFQEVATLEEENLVLVKQ